MSNYTPTGIPLTSTRGTSPSIRAEFVLIANAVNSKADAAAVTALTSGNVWGGVQNFTGATATVATQAALDASTKVASTAYADNAVAAGVLTETNNRVAATNLLAPLASPTFTGIPRVPTAALGATTDQAASVLFVNNAIGASGALPVQPGGSGVYSLQSVGSVSSWVLPQRGRTYFTSAQ